MKPRLFLLAVLAFLTALLAFRFKEASRKSIPPPVYNLKKMTTIGCSPDWEVINEWINETDIPPIPGAGIYHWKISTQNDSAQFYFNQGINMYYSFHIIEAMASFKKAVKFDPSCAILYWAQALAYGPNINDLGYAASPEALAAVSKAKQFAGTANEAEKALIDAISVRYTTDSTDKNRASLNQEYTEKMKGVYEKFPAHPDAQALYADAMMLEHPWDLWTIDGTPKPWTPLIRSVLEKLLARTPNHPGANHYYIHVMEPSPYAAKALPSADRLGKLTPGLSHTVHMPSHIYLRTGLYEKGVLVNEKAVASYRKTIPLYSPVTGADFLYLIHNLHMQTNNAMLAGRAGYSAWAAKETVKSIPVDYLSIPGALGNYIQYIYMTPLLVDVRFGNWSAILTREKPGPSLTYANLLYHFGRGMAFCQQGKKQEAGNELAFMEELMKDSALYIPLTPFSAASEGAGVAFNILSGTLHLKEKSYGSAIAAFNEAVRLEEKMVYNEPRDWLLNPKQYLANAYYKAGNLTEAKTTLLKDLDNNNENGWSLFGMWQVLGAQRKPSEAARMLTRFRKAFSKSDVKLYGPVF